MSSQTTVSGHLSSPQPSRSNPTQTTETDATRFQLGSWLSIALSNMLTAVLKLPRFFVSIGLVLTISSLTILYGLLTTENHVYLGARADLTPLFVSVTGSHNAFLAPLRVLTFSFVCLSPGELLLTCVAIMSVGRLERCLGSVRVLQLVAALSLFRVVFVLSFVGLTTELANGLLRPSSLWLCVSVHTIRSVLMRGKAQLYILGVVPLNLHVLQHIVVAEMILMQLASFWDTVVPSVVISLFLCSSFVRLHRWPVWWARGKHCGIIKKSWKGIPNVASPTSASGAQHDAQSVPRVRLPSRRLRRDVQSAPGALEQPAADVVETRLPADLSLGREQQEAELVSMGFSAEQSRRALALSSGDLNAAAVLLIDGQVSNLA